MKLDYTSVILEMRTPGATQNIKIKFSNLEEEIKLVKWADVSTVEITDIPAYRDEKFEDSVTRYVFNKQELWQIAKDNKQYETLIFNSDRI